MKFFTKLIIGLIIFLIIAIGIYILLIKTPVISDTFVYVDDLKDIPENACNEIGKEIWVVEKTGCPACAKAIPILEEIEKENNLKFKYVNLAIAEERDKLLALGFIPTAVPAFIVNCKVHEGALSKESYLELLKTNTQTY